jgi:hypothetical protein
MNYIIVFLILILPLTSIFSNNIPNMDTARKLFYGAVKDEDKLEEAIKEFEIIMKNNPALKGVATTYIGSLTMLKGKHAFWPHKKVEYVNDGLVVMDKGLAIEPENLESLFIYGSTCYYLPFFLGKSDLAVEKLKKMIKLLNTENLAKHDSEIMANSLKFILEKIDVTDDEKSKVNLFLKKLSTVNK